jgi:hypothetical protein
MNEDEAVGIGWEVWFLLLVVGGFVTAGVLTVALGVGGIEDFAPAAQVVIGIPATGAGPPPDPVRAVLGVVAGGLFGSLAVWLIRTTDWGGGEE